MCITRIYHACPQILTMLVFTFIVLTVSILAVIYVFLVMPRAADGADMDIQSTDYARNGLWDLNIPEGSIDAFRRANEHGYGIELCPFLSRNGEILISSGSQVKPTLRELLSLIDGNVPILIEIKSGSNIVSLCKKLCLIMDGYHGAFAIESLDPNVLGFFKKYRPRYARGQMVPSRSTMPKVGKLKRFALAHLFFNVISRPDFIVTDGNLIYEPAFLLATKIFCKRGFVRPVKTQRQYLICRRRSLYAIFENIKPQ